MARLDTELNSLLAKKILFAQNPAETAFRIDPFMQIPVTIQFTGSITDIATPGLEIRDVTAHVAFGTVTIDALEQLSGNTRVTSIDKHRTDILQLHDSVPDIQANQVWSRSGDHFSGYTGRNVIVGIIDTGIDFRHKNFRKPDGTTRILKIWDQTIIAPVNPPQGGETIPGPIALPAPLTALNTPLGYGVVYDMPQINDTLTSDNPVVRVRHADTDGHGTHVAGIAAGNGKQAGGCHGEYRYIGVAPEADLVVVRLWGLSGGDKGENQTPPANPPVGAPGNLVSDALKFIINEAINQSKPVVINCSFGLFTNRMDGSDGTSQTVNTLLAAHGTGTAVVWAAGNDGNAGFHATGLVPASGSPPLVLEFNISGGDTESRNLVIDYTGNNLEVQVTSPGGGPAGTVAWVTGPNGSSATANGAGGSVVVTNNANSIGISITPPPATGTPPVKQSNVANTKTAKWKIEIRNKIATPTPFNAFCLHGSSHDSRSPYFLNNVTTNSTMTQQASGRDCVTVGSYIIDGQLKDSSGRGPTLDAPARTKPEICAPGVDITSAAIAKERQGDTCANCCCQCCQDWYLGLGGTSMAAPHVAGAIALILHKNPSLTHTQIKALLTANFNAKPGDAPPPDIFGWGAGKASAKLAVEATAQVNPPVAFTAVAEELHQPVIQQFLDTEFGKTYYKLGEKYFREILNLINTNKRVATAWHRSKGPVWTRMAINAFYNPEFSISLSAGGLRFAESVDNFLETLKSFASEELKTDIGRYLPNIYLLPEKMTMMEMISVLGNHQMPSNELYKSA